MGFEEIIQKVQALLATKKPAAIAVSGFGGSGKTTLAERLKQHFENSTLLQLDNFLIDRGEGDGWQGGYDWRRFERVLKDVQAGKDLHYRWATWC